MAIFILVLIRRNIMNLRTISTITLSAAFAVLLVIGILLYATPYNYFVGSLHIWGAVLFLACIALHIKHNAKTYKNHMQKRLGKWSLCRA
jgi:heme A synthase